MRMEISAEEWVSNIREAFATRGISYQAFAAPRITLRDQLLTIIVVKFFQEDLQIEFPQLSIDERSHW